MLGDPPSHLSGIPNTTDNSAAYIESDRLVAELDQRYPAPEVA